MFITYKSNEINTLILKMSEIIQKKPLPSIFEQELLIHDNEVLFEYLNIFIANKLGISANFKYFHPKDFISKILKNNFLKKGSKNVFTQSILTWTIMKLLKKKHFNKYFDSTKNKIKKFKISFLMARIFKKYLIYRPDWINMWEKEENISHFDENDKWQIILWQEIINDIKNNHSSASHTGNLLDAFKMLIQEKKIKKKCFPKRFFIISCFSLTPHYINIFEEMSKYSDIYFLHITHFKKSIFDIKLEMNQLTEKTIKDKITSSYSMIQLSENYENIFLSYTIKSKKILSFFKKNKFKNLLNNLKIKLFKKQELNINEEKKKYY